LKFSGERPVEGQTPDSLLALHAAGYREVLARMEGGRVLDVGCGLGDQSQRFLDPSRAVVGVDYDLSTAATAVRARPGLAAVCTDGTRLGLRDETFDWVCSSHLIEHFRAPEGHVTEVSRVLAPGGAAFFLTPNATADFENPYHVHLFGPAELREVLGRHFEDVEVLGLDGNEVVKADFEARRAAGARMLRLVDPFGWRHKLPQKGFILFHELGRLVMYTLKGKRWAGGSTGIDHAAFSITEAIDETTLVLFAIARTPR
jgi:SAM-dependent methyltransferase